MNSGFEHWWHTNGSCLTPNPKHDVETHVRHVAEKAWTAGRNRLHHVYAPIVDALYFIAEESDSGRCDGVPEPCPAHDSQDMWITALHALSLMRQIRSDDDDGPRPGQFSRKEVLHHD